MNNSVILDKIGNKSQVQVTINELDNKAKMDKFYEEIISNIKNPFSIKSNEHQLSHLQQISIQNHLIDKIQGIQTSAFKNYKGDRISGIQREYTQVYYALREYMYKKFYIDIGEFEECVQLIPYRKYRMDIFNKTLQIGIDIDVYHTKENVSNDKEKDKEILSFDKRIKITRIASKEQKRHKGIRYINPQTKQNIDNVTLCQIFLSVLEDMFKTQRYNQFEIFKRATFNKNNEARKFAKFYKEFKERYELKDRNGKKVSLFLLNSEKTTLYNNLVKPFGIRETTRHYVDLLEEKYNY